jgi:uncharacterized membrane protein
MLSFLAFSILIGAFLLALCMYTPVTRGEDAFFGVRVSPEVYNGEGKRLLHQYYFWLVMTFLEIEAIGILISAFRPQVLIARLTLLILFMPAAQILYVIYYNKVKHYRLVDEKQRFASGLRHRRLADYTSIALEIAVALLIIAPIPVLIYYYPLLPDRIPVHWNIHGQPDSWGNKSFASIFLLPIMMIYLQGLMLIMKHGLMQAKMTLPIEHTEQYLKLKEESLSVTMKMMDHVRLGTSIMLSTLSLGIISTVSGAPVWRWIIVIVIATSLILPVVCFYAAYRLMKINTQLRASTGRSYVQRQTDADRWYCGGIFYFNPDDPALWVERMVGLGYTVNMGNKKAYMYLAYVLLLPLVLTIVLHSK